MKTIETIFATTCLLLMLAGFPIIAITGNEILAILVGGSGVISLGFWLATDFIQSLDINRIISDKVITNKKKKGTQ